MAEFVQQSLCQIKDDLSQIHELTDNEKKKIYKRHEKFEYRIRRRQKSEQDFLQYIMYAQDILKLLSIRKRTARSKKGVEIPIIMRIHNLYQLCEGRFPQCVEVWQSHIEFCTKHKEFSRVSRLYQQLLRTHSTEPELWVQAARWEVEQSNQDTARALMQRCISNNKTSRVAWLEYFKLEIELAKMEEEPSGKIAEVVSSHALQERPDDVDLLMGLLRVAQRVVFMKAYTQELLTHLRENFSHLATVWDFLARRMLPSKKKRMAHWLETKEEYYVAEYQQAVSKVPTTEMWTFYIKACMDLIAVPSASQETIEQRAERTLEVFKAAADADCLSVDMYKAWVFLLKDMLEMDAARGVSQQMVKRYPQSAAAWTQFLVLLFQTLSAPALVVSCLDTALLAVPEKDAWCLWEPVLQYLATSNYPELEPLMERACQRMVREVCMPAKLLYLRWTALTKHLKATRALYGRFSGLKPVPLEFYFEYAKQELMQDEVKMVRVRRAYEDAVSDYGKTDPEVWLRYIHMEMTAPSGDRASASVLHARAVVNLPEGALRESFVQSYGDVVSA